MFYLVSSTQPKMNMEGQLNINLRTHSQRVDQVSIESNRPVHASRVFHGKALHYVQKTLPLLFSICGTAQACASARACEQAQRVQASAAVESVRNSLVEMETIREHCWQILLNWSDFLDEEPAKSGMADILSLQTAYRQAITGGRDPFAQAEQLEVENTDEPSTALKQKISLTLEQTIFRRLPSRWLEIEHQRDLSHWVRSTNSVAARLIHHVTQNNWEASGRCEIEALPALKAKQMHKLLQDDQFVSQPQWSNSCYETSCYTRADSPLVQQLRSLHGNGLLSRLVARLTEIAQLSIKLASRSTPENMNAAGGDTAANQNLGIGQVPAARGQLLHRVQLENQKVVHYQIVAPTEWNFHPQGVVAKSLSTLVGDTAQITQQARLIINAIDPCVAYQLSVN